MNRITIIGRLAADSEVRFTGEGKPICQFRLAEDVGYGEKKTTNWYQCQIWGKRGESVAPYLLKGSAVTVFGSLTLRPWTDKNGVEKLSADVNVDDVFLAPKSHAGTTGDKPAPKASTKSTEEDPDIPF